LISSRPGRGGGARAFSFKKPDAALENRYRPADERNGTLARPWPKVAQEVTLRIAVETGNDASELYKKTYSNNV
jgi:hypothetical protein